jgi:predicted membrane protein
MAGRDVVLDLREASVAAERVAIDVSTVFGDVDRLVPEGVAVGVRSR